MRIETRLTAAAREAALLIAEGAAQRDLDRILPHAEMNIVRRHGLPAANIPLSFGGGGESFADLARIILTLAAADPNVAQSLQSHYFLVDLLRIEGSDAQRRRIYADILGGAIIANAIAERGAKGAADYKTRLSGEYLDGCKHYCTGSLVADFLYVHALSENDQPVLVLVPKDRAGIRVKDDWDGMGQRTTGSGTVLLERVRVAPDEVIALNAWGRRRTHLNAAAQLSHAAIDAGIARGGLNDLIAHTRRPARAVEDPYVLHAVGEMAIQADSAEAMLLRAASVLDEAVTAMPPDSEEACVRASITVAQAKAVCTAAALRVCEMMFQVSGASATLRALNFDRHWRNARTHTTHDPVAQKYRAVGAYLLNDTPPAIHDKI